MLDGMRNDRWWRATGQDYLNIYDHIDPMDETSDISDELAESVDGLPNLCGEEGLIGRTIADAGGGRVYPMPNVADPFGGIDSAFAIALHMHQPLIPAGGEALRTAAVIGNLRYMAEHPDIGDNHNASVFRWC